MYFHKKIYCPEMNYFLDSILVIDSELVSISNRFRCNILIIYR